jgi:hypothetical protein
VIVQIYRAVSPLSGSVPFFSSPGWFFPFRIHDTPCAVVHFPFIDSDVASAAVGTFCGRWRALTDDDRCWQALADDDTTLTGAGLDTGVPSVPHMHMEGMGCLPGDDGDDNGDSDDDS